MCREMGRAVLVGIYRILAGSGIAALGFVAACYTYPSRPLTDVPPSAEVSATISDVGRVALAEPIGSGVDRISGQVVETSDTATQLMVSEVHFLSGLSNKWQGQTVTLRPQYVTSVAQRTYSRQRTVMAVIVGALLVATALAASFTGLFSGSSSSDNPVEPPPVT